MEKKKKTENNSLSNGQIQFVWGLVCSSSSIDVQKNNISLFNIIEQINVPTDAFEQGRKNKKPVLIPSQSEIIVFLRRAVNPALGNGEPISVDMKVSFVDPRGNQLVENLITFEFPATRRYRYRIINPGFFITEPGDYVYRVELRSGEQESFGSPNDIPLEIRSL